jgi:hypothetical protein
MTTKPPNDIPEGYEKLDDELGDPWKPTKIGEVLKGKYKGSMFITSKGRTFQTQRILTDNGMRCVAGAVLDRKFERLPDDTGVYLKYKGMITTSQGETRDFDVYHENVELLPARNMQQSHAEGEYKV